MPDQSQPKITAHGLRNHASALYPPDRKTSRELLYLAAGELERTRERLARSTGQVEALRVECERLLHENSLLRQRNVVLKRENEECCRAAYLVARIATKGLKP